MRRRWQVVVTVSALVMAGILPVGAQPAAGSGSAAPAGVRPTSAVVAALLADTLKDSSTLRQIVSDIAAYGGLVYVDDASSAALLQRGLTGATSLNVVCVADRRIVQVALVTGRGDTTIESLGHELQHAREMLASKVTNRTSAIALYRRIGTRTRPDTYETTMAQEAGVRVLDETRHRQR